VFVRAADVGVPACHLVTSQLSALGGERPLRKQLQRQFQASPERGLVLGLFPFRGGARMDGRGAMFPASLRPGALNGLAQVAASVWP